MKAPFCFTLLALLLSLPLHAQDVGASASQDSAAAPTCKKPAVISHVRKADDDSDFQEKLTAYQDCIKVYTDTQNKLAQNHVNAANAAIADFNDFVKKVNDARQNSQ